jgi:uncharacterized protein
MSAGATRWSRLAATVFALIFAVFTFSTAQALTFPPLTGRVVDDANVLTPEAKTELTEKLAALETKTGRQLVIATLPSLQGDDIEDYGYQLGRAWGIGQKGKDNGAVFIIAPSEHKARIEVGYGLEPILTDAMSRIILEREVFPKFRAGDMSGGIIGGTDALVQQLGLDPAAAQAAMAQATATETPAPMHHRRGGGLGALISLGLIIFVLSRVFGGRRRYGSGGGGLGGALPWMVLGGMMGGGRERDDDWGGGGGGGSDGGGFSGGAVWAGWRPDLLFGGGDWSAGTGTTFAPSLVQALETYAAGQALLFAALVLIFAIPPIRRFLTPSTLKSHRVHRAAVQQFLATGLHAAAERTGVVIFASQDDRRVELLADDAIHEAVGDTAWKAAVKAVQDAMKRGDPASGYVKAIDICGAAMAEHFPATGDKVNALSDRLLEL